MLRPAVAGSARGAGGGGIPQQHAACRACAALARSCARIDSSAAAGGGGGSGGGGLRRLVVERGGMGRVREGLADAARRATSASLRSRALQVRCQNGPN